MFKCGDKCTGVLAAEARLVREKVCFMNAKKENDCRMMKIASRKVKNTKDYIKFMEEWPPSVNLAIMPALMVANMRPKAKKEIIMNGIGNVLETGINPIDGLPLTRGVTAVVIKFLIAKHDKTEFVREKTFLLNKENVNILKWLKVMCKLNPKAENFVGSLMVAR